MSDERSFVEEARRAKLPQLAALGVRPFAYRFDRSHLAADAIALYEQVGYAREGVLRKSVFKDGQVIDSVLYAKVAS